jgi:hypothetical protein
MHVPGDSGLHAFAIWGDFAVSPVVRIRVDVLENLASVVRQVNWRVTWVRLGDAFSV